jgi:hypothetical protein
MDSDLLRVDEVLLPIGGRIRGARLTLFTPMNLLAIDVDGGRGSGADARLRAIDSEHRHVDVLAHPDDSPMRRVSTNMLPLLSGLQGPPILRVHKTDLRDF